MGKFDQLLEKIGWGQVQEEEENEEEYGLIILKSQMEHGEEFLVPIEDEEEIDKVYDLFMEQILADEE